MLKEIIRYFTFFWWLDDFDSVSKLISDPKAYDQKKVRVVGYVTLQFEGSGIYSSQRDMEQSATKMGLWLSLSHDQFVAKKEFTKKKCVVEAHFSSRNKGHLGLWGGGLERVTKLEPVCEGPC